MTDNLKYLFSPQSVALIGASRRRGNIGSEIFHNILDSGFQGVAYPINPHAKAVHGVRAYASLADLPEPVELVIIAVPAAAVPAAIEACAAAGVKALVIITAGFKEVGGEGARVEAAIAQLARGAQMRLVGPNCLGVINSHPSVSLNGTFAPSRPRHGHIGMLSQSGALGVAILDYGLELGLGVSTFVSVGNKADVSANDMLEFWEADPDTHVALLYLESFGNPSKFMRIARRVTRVKPVIAVKSGRSNAGQRAATSHTGSMAGADNAVNALFVRRV